MSKDSETTCDHKWKDFGSDEHEELMCEKCYVHFVPKKEKSKTTPNTPLDWIECPPEKPGAYIVGYNVEGRRKEASIGYWDGKVWQHWSGFYDHAITHYMPTDLPEKAA